MPAPFGPVTSTVSPVVDGEVDAGEGVTLPEPCERGPRRRSPQASASASTPARNTIAITPFIPRNAMSTRDRSSSETIEFS